MMVSSPTFLHSVALYVMPLGDSHCDLPVHFDAPWPWEENANEQRSASKCSSSLCKNDVMLFSARGVDNGISLPH